MEKSRSREQLILLLKLIEVNHAVSKNRNVEVRQKIWAGITQKLNRLSGAVKTMEGWKRCYIAWRTKAGDNYKEEMKTLLREVPNDDRYLIAVSDNEAESSPEKECSHLNPITKQQLRLHNFVLKNRGLLLSTADDEPLKKRLWENITSELNSIPGGHVWTKLQWQNFVDWEKYRTKKGRPPQKRSTITTNILHDTKATEKADLVKSSKVDVNTSGSMDYPMADETTMPSTSYELSEDDNNSNDTDTFDKDSFDKILNELKNESMTDNDDDGDCELNNEPKTKRIKPSPLVNSFKFSSRLVSSVDQLKDDVRSIKDCLKETANSLASIRGIMEQQCQQQEEMNAVLKRNTQLLKVLVEFKMGKRTSFDKKTAEFSNAF